jgi:DHA3 family tetracycline resistance protein-like MFS transporter
MRTPPRLGAATTYLVLEGLGGVLATLFGTIFSVYLIVEAELGGFELLILGTVLEGSILLFEVPTGVVADTVSRRLSVIVGMAITGGALLLFGSVPRFAWLVVASSAWGLGATFVSGAYEAWITDEVGEEAAAQLYVRGAQAFWAGALVAIPVAVGLGIVSLGLPIVVAGVGWIALAAAMVVLMPETRFERTSDGGSGRLLETLRGGVRAVRRSHVLAFVFVVAALHGASTEAFDRLSGLHLLRGTSFPAEGTIGIVVWFGAIEAVGVVLSIVAAALIRRRADLASHAGVTRVLTMIDAGLVGAVLVFALTRAFWLALIAWWIVAFLREVRSPIFTAWINRGLDPATRATVNSMAGQMDAIGQIAGGPAIGVVAIRFGVPVAIALAALIRAPALALYPRTTRRSASGDATTTRAAPASPGTPGRDD